MFDEEESEKQTQMKADCLMCLSLVYFILDDDKNTVKTLEKVKALNICEKEVSALEEVFAKGDRVMFKEDVSFYSFELSHDSFLTPVSSTDNLLQKTYSDATYKLQEKIL